MSPSKRKRKDVDVIPCVLSDESSLDPPSKRPSQKKSRQSAINIPDDSPNTNGLQQRNRRSKATQQSTESRHLPMSSRMNGAHRNPGFYSDQKRQRAKLGPGTKFQTTASTANVNAHVNVDRSNNLEVPIRHRPNTYASQKYDETGPIAKETPERRKSVSKTKKKVDSRDNYFAHTSHAPHVDSIQGKLNRAINENKNRNQVQSIPVMNPRHSKLTTAARMRSSTGLGSSQDKQMKKAMEMVKRRREEQQRICKKSTKKVIDLTSTHENASKINTSGSYSSNIALDDDEYVSSDSDSDSYAGVLVGVESRFDEHTAISDLSNGDQFDFSVYDNNKKQVRTEEGPILISSEDDDALSSTERKNPNGKQANHFGDDTNSAVTVNQRRKKRYKTDLVSLPVGATVFAPETGPNSVKSRSEGPSAPIVEHVHSQINSKAKRNKEVQQIEESSGKESLLCEPEKSAYGAPDTIKFKSSSNVVDRSNDKREKSTNSKMLSSYQQKKPELDSTQSRRRECGTMVNSATNKRVLPPQSKEDLCIIIDKETAPKQENKAVTITESSSRKKMVSKSRGPIESSDEVIHVGSVRKNVTTKPMDLAMRENNRPLRASNRLEKNIRVKGLTQEELQEVRSVTSKVKKNQILAVVKEARISLRGEDFACLRGSRWLNDEIMNSFVALINARNKRHFGLDGDATGKKENISSKQTQEGRISWTSETAIKSFKQQSCNQFFNMCRPRTHIFNTFFYARLEQGGYDYDGVRRWLKKAGRHIKDLDLILVPVNLSNFHWVIAVIDLRNRAFIYMDSMFGHDEADVCGLLKHWLMDEVKDKLGEEVMRKLDISNWSYMANPGYLPEQQDGGSCGIFSLYVAEYLERGKKPDFTQDNILTMRQRTVLFLKHGKIPT